MHTQFYKELEMDKKFPLRPLALTLAAAGVLAAALSGCGEANSKDAPLPARKPRR